ncbi:MAG: spirocyclase AveC family protein, partial [Mycobacterium sp.]
MSTDQSIPLSQGDKPARALGRDKPNWGRWVSGAALAAFALFFIVNCRVALDPRVANPNVQGRPRPVKFIFGLDYITFLHISTCIMLLVLLVVFIRGWRRNPGSPVMLMFLCTTLIVWQDPIMNWSPFAVYNPDLIHWPEYFPLVSISPTVEPFVVFGYVMFYFGPYFPAVWILRKLQARHGPTSYVSRHPLISLGLLTLAIGFVFDAFLENILIHWGMYIYSQVIPWGSVFTGTTFQFPLIWESFSVTFVMIPAAI